MYWAKICRGRDAADQQRGHVAMAGEQDVLGLGEQRRPHRDGLLPAPHVDAAQDLALTVQLALDAVLDLPHQGHVIQALAGQFGPPGGVVRCRA